MIDSSDPVSTGHHPLGSTDLPCPPWCERPVGHPFDGRPRHDGGLVARQHWITVEDAVVVACDEEAVDDSGPVWSISAPYLWADREAFDLDELDLAAARRLRDALTRALEVLGSLA